MRFGKLREPGRFLDPEHHPGVDGVQRAGPTPDLDSWRDVLVTVVPRVATVRKARRSTPREHHERFLYQLVGTICTS
jgi:hypothetical protein